MIQVTSRRSLCHVLTAALSIHMHARWCMACLDMELQYLGQVREQSVACMFVCKSRQDAALATAQLGGALHA